MKNRNYLFSYLQCLVFVLSLLTNWYAFLIISLFIIIIIATLDKLGKGIVLREVIAMHTIFVCLIAPLWGYHAFTVSNALSRLWVKYMPVPEPLYYSYALPAVAGFILFLTWPLRGSNSDTGKHLSGLLVSVKVILAKYPQVGFYLIIIGLLSSVLTNFLPGALQFVMYLFYMAGFTGLLYLYYAPRTAYRLPGLLIFGVFVMIEAVRGGMFTIVAYMGLTMFSFFFLGRQLKLWKKTLWFAAGVFVLLILQLAKPAYRQMTWREEYAGNKGVLLGELILDQLSSLNLTSSDALFPVYTRTNQGFNVALVMKRIPQKQEHDYGNRLFLTFISAFVPRVVWPDKPEAGGKFNMKYYTGYTIRGWSTNVGPLGEAYGSFGTNAGIVYMLLLGAFIRWAYAFLFRLSGQSSPLLVLWMPVLFYQVTYSAETDTLQIMNSLFKSAFFIWVLYKLLPGWFGKSGTRAVKIKHPAKHVVAGYTPHTSLENKG